MRTTVGTLRRATTIGAAVLLTVALGSGVAAQASTSPRTAIDTAFGTASQPAHRTTRLVLDHAVTLPNAQLAAARSDRSVVGYRFSNPGVVGEFYPNPDLDAAAFSSRFHTQFGSQPRVTELIAVSADLTTASASGRAARTISTTASVEANRIDADPRLTDGLPPFDPTPGVGTAAQQLMAHTSTVSSAAPPTELGQDWRPANVQLDTTPPGDTGNVEIGTYDFWVPNPGGGLTGESLSGVPANWGIEFRFQLHNEAIESSDGASTRAPTASGICPNTPNVRDQFWARNYGYVSWTVFHVGSDSLDSIGAYADTNDAADPCSTQTLSVGIGKPQNIHQTPGGTWEFGTEIYTHIGSVSRSAVTASLDAVEGYSCRIFPYTVPDTNCMGADSTRQWPVENYPKSVTLLSRQGAATPSSPSTLTPVYTNADGLPSPRCIYYDKSRQPQITCGAP
jgi:hypothetical protein